MSIFKKKSELDDKINECYLKAERAANADNYDKANFYIARAKELENFKFRQSDQTNKLIELCIAGLSIILPLVSYGHWFKKSLRFEETGSFASTASKNLLQKMNRSK